jgi:hypothetical protein
MRITQTYLATATALLLVTTASAGPLDLGGQGALGGGANGIGSVGAIGGGSFGANPGLGHDASGRLGSRTSALNERVGTMADRGRSRTDKVAGRASGTADSVSPSVDSVTDFGAWADGAAAFGDTNATGAIDGSGNLVSNVSEPAVQSDQPDVAPAVSERGVGSDEFQAPAEPEPTPATTLGGGASSDAEFSGEARAPARAEGSASASASASYTR